MTATRRVWLVAALVVALLVLVGSVVAVGAWAAVRGPGSAGWSGPPFGVGQRLDGDEWPGMMGSTRERPWEQRQWVCPSAPATPTPTPTPEATQEGES